MARMRQCITPTQGLSLVNSLIEQTPIQCDVVSFKKRGSTCGDFEGKFGTSYWRSFHRRNAHLVVSKKGQKCDLIDQFGQRTQTSDRCTIIMGMRWSNQK